jgi:hypothetical protein
MGVGMAGGEVGVAAAAAASPAGGMGVRMAGGEVGLEAAAAASLAGVAAVAGAATLVEDVLQVGEANLSSRKLRVKQLMRGWADWARNELH